MDLNSILGVLAAGNTANEIGKNFNIDSNTVTQVITSALPTLIGAMQKNASTEAGADSLLGALTSHIGDTSVNLSNESLTDGGKILKHILGNDSGDVYSALAKQNGISSSQVGSILAAIAPVLLGLLGKGQQGNNGGASALEAMLGGMLGGGNSSAMGGLGSILGGLGSLFGKK